jgi:hypothetical protein
MACPPFVFSESSWRGTYGTKPHHCVIFTLNRNIIKHKGFIGKFVGSSMVLFFVDQMHNAMDEASCRPPRAVDGLGSAGLQCAACGGLRPGLSPRGHEEAVHTLCEVTVSNLGWERAV